MESKHPSSRRYPAELKERAVRLVKQDRAESGSEVGVIARVARQLGVGDQSFRNWFRWAEIDAGHRQGLSSPHMQQPATAMGEAVEEPLMILITARQ